MKKVPLLHLLMGAYPQEQKERLLSRIVCKEVTVDGQLVSDPKQLVPSDGLVGFIVKSPYVSRGGLKLQKALLEWELPVAGKVFLDAGSSTGGFTDCLLHFGAREVHAVDVGYNQLAWSLRSDTRVHVHERTNLMHIKELVPPADAAVADLSFRSVSGAATALLDLTSERWAVILIKPQFELHTRILEFDGIIRDQGLRIEILLNLIETLRQERVAIRRICTSPITGTKGNIEYLALITDDEPGVPAVRDEKELFSQLEL